MQGGRRELFELLKDKTMNPEEIIMFGKSKNPQKILERSSKYKGVSMNGKSW